MTEEQPLSVDQLIARAAHLLEQEVKTRELSLGITKLQEAVMWLHEHQKAKAEIIKRTMGPNNGSTNIPV